MVTLVPLQFFNPSSARDALAEVCDLAPDARVKYISLPQYSAALVYDIPEGEDENSLPGVFYALRDLESCKDYNKIVAGWEYGVLSLAVAQGGTLLFANEFRAADFTTAEYFVFLTLKTLQLNPEVSTICFRTPLSPEDEMNLYRYFKSVESL